MAPDPSELEHMLASHGDRIYGYALYLLGQQEEAEDVVQEVFLRLWRRTAESPRNLESWLLRVTHNLCVDARRRRRTSSRRLRVLEPSDLENLPAAGQDPDPARQVERQEERRALLGALAELPAAARGVVLMHYHLGLPVKEIARTLGTSEGAIKLRLHRARRALQQWLGPAADPAAVPERGAMPLDRFSGKRQIAGGEG